MEMPKKQQSERLRYGDVVLFYSDEVKGYIEGAIEGAQAKLSLASLSASGEVTKDQTGSRRTKSEQAEAARRRSVVVAESGKSQTLQPSELRDCLFVFEPKQVCDCVYTPLAPAGCFKQHAQTESLPPGCVSCSLYASAARSLHWQVYHQQSKAVARAAEEQEQESNKQKTNKVRTARICCNCITHGTLLIASRHTLNCGRL